MTSNVETIVLGLLLMMLLLLLGFAVFLWAGALFFQGYLYSQPAGGLFWRALAAGTILATFLGFWCVLDYRHPGHFNATWFEPTPSEDEVFDKFWAVKGDREILYEAHKRPGGQIEYWDAAHRPWARSDADGIVEAIVVEDKDGQKTRFNAELTDDKKFKTDPGEPVRYVEAGGRGRVMTATYIGKLPVSQWGATLAKILLSLVHFALWFACLWLLLQFQWGHAFGMALILWLAITLTLLPIVFTAAEEAARQRVVANHAPNHTAFGRAGFLAESRPKPGLVIRTAGEAFNFGA